MKNYRILFIILLIPFLYVFNGCKEESTTQPEPTVNESQLLLELLEQIDYAYGSGSFVISASDVRTNMLTDPAKQYIIDIRSAEHFAQGHIEGAVNVSWANLYSHVKGLNAANYNKIVVTCYSGQSAAYAVSLLRASGGLNNVFSLKWGMSSWDSVFAQNYWLNASNVSNARAADFVTTASPPKNAKGSLPKLNTGKKTAAEILGARIQALFEAGYNAATINHTNLFNNLSGYYIINYWPLSLYLNPGHIPGAINYDPSGTNYPFKSDKDLLTLPTDKTIVLYCYTGQTSSFFAAYLRLLGYDVKSLLYGGNGMIYDLMKNNGVANTFIPANEIKGYPYVVGG